MKFKAVSWKIWDSERTLPVPSLWTPFSLWWSLKHRENLSFSQSSFKIWDSRRTLPVPSLWTPFSLWWSLKNTKTFVFSQSSFMKNMRFRKDTASAKSLNPIFSVMKSKTQRKLVFFTEQFQNMRFQKDTASAKSLNPIFSVMKFKKHKKLLFFHRAVSWKIWDSGRTLPVPSLWTSLYWRTVT